jgi:hypothetical protein
MNSVKRRVDEPQSGLRELRPERVHAELAESGKKSLPYQAVEPLAMALDAAAVVSASMFSGWYYHRFVLEIVGEPSQSLILGAVVASLFVPFCFGFRSSLFWPVVPLLSKQVIHSPAELPFPLC